jgi:hypothetical protein
MTAQGIEAATADKTRSGLAEGESPVRQDAPNSLYQEGYSMTDTTDQQAVTVAQEDREAATLYWQSQHIGSPETYAQIRAGRRDDSHLIRAFARHRLASVSSASADWTRTKAFDEAAAECLRAAKASTFADTVSEDERNGHRSACNLLAMNFRVMASRAAPEWLTPEPASSNLDRFIAEIHKATPNGEYILVQHHPNGDWSVSRKCEPVPATNQAGEVDPREAAARIIYGWEQRILGFDYASQSVRDLAYRRASEILALAALATQPATSQEGERVRAITKPWRGGDGAPDDWDGGSVLRADGQIEHSDDITIQQWQRPIHGCKWNVVAYTSALAATPTPPTLSEDLREALSDMLEAFTNIECGEVDRRLAVETARAALAQVRAS